MIVLATNEIFQRRLRGYETIEANNCLGNKWNISKNIERIGKIETEKYFLRSFYRGFIQNGRHKEFNPENHTSRLIPCLSLQCDIKVYDL